MFSLTVIADLGLLKDSAFATALGGQVLLHALAGYHRKKFETASSLNAGTGIWKPIR